MASRKGNLRFRYQIMMLLVAIIVVMLVSATLVVVPTAISNEKRQAFDRINSANNLKTLWLLREFEELQRGLVSLAANVALVDELRFVNKLVGRSDSSFELYRQIRNNEKGEDPLIGDKLSLYWQSHARIHPYFRFVESSFPGSEILILRPDDGMVIYKLGDSGQLMKRIRNNEEWGASLTRCFIRAKNSPGNVVFEDFELKTDLSPHKACAAVLLLIDGEPEAVLIQQFSGELINGIMALRPGLGDSGETYLVNPEKLMLTESRFSPDTSVMQQFVDSRAVREGLAGFGGQSIIEGYNGETVFSVWQPIRIDMMEWVLIAEISDHEVFRSLRANASQLLLWLWLGFLVLLVVAYIFSRQTERPLLALLKNAKRLAGGDYSDSIMEKPGSREIIDLVGTFNEMAAQIRERTEALNAALAKAEEASQQADRANRAKGEFLSRMSHELRTPLNGVLGYSQLLQRDQNIQAGQRETLSAIESCGQHLLELINDVLDLERIERGLLEVDIQACVLPQLLQRVVDVVQPRANEKGLLFRVNQEDIPQTICTDAMKLRQVLINLLGNAIKFTDHGSVTLSVTRVAGKNELHFSVWDTGIGIPDDKQQEIFSPFAQTREGREAGGTGLGLSITREICQALGADLNVSSEVNQGTEFAFSLPYTVAEGPVPSPIASGSKLPVLPKGKVVDVLVADDNATNRDILAQLLTAAKFVVHQADNGQQAVSFLQNHDVDLVLMDLRMPVMGGLEATRILRADSITATIPIIAISATIQPELHKEVLSAGCNVFVSKPIDINALFEQIAKLLDIEFVVALGDNIVEAAQVTEPVEIELTDIEQEQLKALCFEIEQTARMGDVFELRKQIAMLADLMSEEDARVTHLQRLVESFSMDAVRAYCQTLSQKITESEYSE
ncbi:MAG: signal transduction histidine kinase/DNA-binding response OmpR family regulator [Chitinophagales bacterium]|jgi:signal transduction histidine kinase/DNA-binding response OmpR family regulator